MIALDIEVADELHVDPAPVLRLQWQIVVTDIAVGLQLFENAACGGFVFEEADLEKFFADEVGVGVAEELHHEGIRVDDFSGRGIDNENAVARGFKQAAVAQLRGVEDVVHWALAAGPASVSCAKEYTGSPANDIG